MTQAEYFPTGDENTLGQRYVSTAINMTMLRDHTWPSCSMQPSRQLRQRQRMRMG